MLDVISLQLSEEQAKNRQDATNAMIGALTTMIPPKIVAPDAPRMPKMPSWWYGDEDASRSSIQAMGV